MGIPHLAQQLQPHGTKVLLLKTSSESDSTPAIIDGPSLAYHCFYICLNRQSGARNAYEALPSYRELGDAAVSWLDQIEQYGFIVEAVYFDGLLPHSKKLVRLSRLQNYANQLVTFRASNKEDLPARAIIEKQVSSSDLLSTVSLPARLKALPAPPFLVPAVFEAIASSRFANVTSTIPGEADAYCAQFARLTGGTIITSDSDLLVHDLGQAGKVILFRDLELIHIPSKGACLRTQQYEPSAIAEKFGLNNLVRLAFFMTEDNHCKISEATRLAKEKNPTSDEFNDFKEQYASLPVLSKLAQEYLSHSDRPVYKTLSALDPRISELVHQISIVNVANMAESKTLDMYLPFLLDDSTRTSAWRAGVEIRTLAYSILRLLDPHITQIDEYERKGTRISSTTTTLLDPLDLHAVMMATIETIAADLLGARTASLATPIQWRLFAAKTVCESNSSNNKSPPSSADLARLVTGSGQGPLTWSFIHAFAQLQSVLYSTRLLHQLSTLVLAFLHESQEKPDYISSLTEMVKVLENLPSLADLFDVKHVEDDETVAVGTLVAEMLKSMGITDVSGPKALKAKKKRKKKGEHVSETTPPAWRSNNMFGSLS